MKIIEYLKSFLSIEMNHSDESMKCSTYEDDYQDEHERVNQLREIMINRDNNRKQVLIQKHNNGSISRSESKELDRLLD